MTPAPWLDPASLLAGFAAGFLAGGIAYGTLLRWELRAAQPPSPEPDPAPRFPIGGMMDVFAQDVPRLVRGEALPLELHNRLVTELMPGEFARVEWSMLTPAQWRALWQSTATTHLAGGGRPFSRDELERVRDLLIGRGVASWKDPAHRALGWELHPHSAGQSCV